MVNLLIITILYTTTRRIDFGSPVTVLATEHVVESIAVDSIACSDRYCCLFPVSQWRLGQVGSLVRMQRDLWTWNAVTWTKVWLTQTREWWRAVQRDWKSRRGEMQQTELSRFADVCMHVIRCLLYQLFCWILCVNEGNAKNNMNIGLLYCRQLTLTHFMKLQCKELGCVFL